MTDLQITCFGEVLWDIFPTNKKVGGAPLNVANRLRSYGNKVSIISRIGSDELGVSLIRYLKNNNLNCENIQKDHVLETGQVEVTLNRLGSASYDIRFPCAWDHIELTDSAIKVSKSSDAFVYGSLAGRNSTSLTTLLHLLEMAPYKVFDVNLRAPHYSKETLIKLMEYADLIKFNDEELIEISGYLGSKHTTIEENITFVSKITNTKNICVTKGKLGAVLFYNNSFFNNKGYPVEVVDTVGAGDSFLATLLHFLLNGESPQNAINYASAMGALVAGSEGANPEISLTDIFEFINSKA